MRFTARRKLSIKNESRLVKAELCRINVGFDRFFLTEFILLLFASHRQFPWQIIRFKAASFIPSTGTCTIKGLKRKFIISQSRADFSPIVSNFPH